MQNLSSIVIDSINDKLEWVQNKCHKLVENSLILKNLDNIILFFIALVLVTSLFLPSEMIGIVAIAVICLTILKLFLLKGQKLELASCNLFLLIFLGFSILSVVNSTMFKYSLMGLSKTLIYLGFYFSTLQYFKHNKSKIVPILFLVAALASVEGVIGIIQNTMDLGNISTWQDTSYVNPEDVVSRIYGTLLPYNPNLLGGYLVVCFGTLLMTTFLAFESKHFKSFLISLIFMTITACTVFLTGCRGAYIALFVMALGVVFASWHLMKHNEKLKKYWQVAVSTMLGLVVVVLAATPSVLKRILSIFVMRQDSSTSFRMNVYNSSFQMFCDNCLLGIGTGNKTFREVYGLYMMSGFDALSCYCIYLEMAVESGIFALLAYLGFLFVILSSSLKTFLVETNLRKKIIVFSLFISIVAVMVHGFVDTVYFRPQIQFVFWTVVSSLIVLIQSKEIPA